MLNRVWEFVSTLMAGGASEIVLLIVLIVVALILFLVGLWVLWKLLGLAAKGILWLTGFITGQARTRTAARKEAQRSRPPAVATGWGGRATRLGLRVALADARRLTSPDAVCIVAVAGEGGAGDLCRSLGLTPPPVASVGIAAGGPTILIDATRANRRELRRLARALPYKRPADGVAVLASADGLPVDAIARTADFARAAGLRVALHLVLPSRSATPAWRIIDANNSDGDAVTTQLAADAVRIWLKQGQREGLQELALAQSQELPGAIDRVLAVAPSSLVDVASLGFSGAGLRGAVAQTMARTRPAATAGVFNAVAYASAAASLALMVLAWVVAMDRADTLRGAVSIVGREAAVPWAAQEIAAVPNATRVDRLAGLGTSLAGISGFSPLSPLASFTPGHSNPRRLGASMLDSYLLRPLGSALERQALERLGPRANADLWLDDARVISDWVSAWEALADDPREVDMQALLAAAFGGAPADWPEDLDLALVETGAVLPLPGEGGFDIPGVTALARDNYILTMRLWAESVYTNGPVAQAARRATDLSSGWRAQYESLMDLRASIQDPGQQWLTASEDRSDHASELRLLGRALALGLVGQAPTVEAKAIMAAVRIAARDSVSQFSLPGVGSLMTRTAQNTGASLQLSVEAAAWLRYLDRVANSGFGQPPGRAGAPIRGTVTVDVDAVADARQKLTAYERLSMDLLADLPAAPVRSLLAELASELVLGVVVEVENALQPDTDLGVAAARAERRAAAATALEDLAEIEVWLAGQQASSQAERVNRVRARVSDGVLSAAAAALAEEDPLGVVVDPTADAGATLRRMDRGVARVRTIYEQYAQPFVDVSTGGGEGEIALQWRDISDDIAAYDRGDADSSLSVLEGNVRAWVEDPAAACASPTSPTGRGDYLATAVTRFRAEVDASCARMGVTAFEELVAGLRDHYDTFLSRSWPFTANGAEADPGAMAEFVALLHAGIDTHEQFLDDLPLAFSEHASFWAPGLEATVRFRPEWRWRPDIEVLTEHMAEVSIEGTEVDEAGVHAWRYGEPFDIRFRIARNSPYRFRLPDGRLTLEASISPSGRGGLLRALENIARGEWIHEAEVQHIVTGQVQTMRISGRFTHEDDRPVAVPTGSPSAI